MNQFFPESRLTEVKVPSAGSLEAGCWFSPGQHGLMSLTASSVLHPRGWIVPTGHPSSGIGQKESRDRGAPCLYISVHSPGER